MPPDYDKQDYWRQRFAMETAFEWLTDSSTFMAIMDRTLDRLDRSARLLHLGSGTSDLHNHLRRRGFLTVTNVDYEPLALKRGQALENSAFGDAKMRYVIADVTQLDLDERYDLAIDKGTADAMSCGGEDALVRMAAVVKKHLAPGGVWISMSYSSSRFDDERLPMTVEVIAKIPTPKRKETDPDIYYWCYMLGP